MKHIKTFEQKNIYFVWKSDKNGEPIDGTDREFKGESRSNVLKLLSHEEEVKDIQKVESDVYNILVRLDNTKDKMLKLIKSTIKKKTN